MRRLSITLLVTLVFAELAAAQSRRALPRATLNVCHDTPYGDFKRESDITKPLQWAIDNQHKGEGFEPYIPAGQYRYTRLRIPPGVGYKLRGAGRGGAALAGMRNMTILKHVGDASPSVTCQGNTVRIEDVCFQGRGAVDKRRGKERHGVGWLNTMVRGQGPPTSAVQFRRVAFYGWETAVQNGETAKTTNCDYLVFEDLVCGDCGVGYLNKNYMGMHIEFDRMLAPDTEVPIRFEAGGTCYVRNCGLGGRPATFLQLAGRRVGDNSGGFFIDGFKIDGSINGKGSAVVEMLEPAKTQIVIEKLTTSNPKYAANGGKLAILKGATSLTVRDSYHPGEIVCEADGVYEPHVLVDNCWLDRDEPRVSGDCALVVRDCVRFKWKEELGQLFDVDKEATARD